MSLEIIIAKRHKPLKMETSPIITPYSSVAVPDEFSYNGLGVPLTQEFANPNPTLQPQELPKDDSLAPLWITLSIFGGLLLLGGIIFVIFWFTRPGQDARTLSTESISTPDETTTGPQVWLKDINGFYLEYKTTADPITATQSTTPPSNNGWTFVRGSTFDNEYKDIKDGANLKYPNADALGMFCWIRNENNQWLSIASEVLFVQYLTICSDADPTDCLSLGTDFVFQSYGSFDGTSLNLTTTPGKHIFAARNASAPRPDPDTALGLYNVLVWDTSASRWRIFTYNIPSANSSDPYPLVDGVNLNTNAVDVLDWATTDDPSIPIPGNVAGYTQTIQAGVHAPISLVNTQPTTAPFIVNPIGIRTFFWETNTTPRRSVKNNLQTFISVDAIIDDPLIWFVEPINNDELVKLFDGQDRYKDSWLNSIGAYKPYSAPTNAV